MSRHISMIVQKAIKKVIRIVDAPDNTGALLVNDAEVKRLWNLMSVLL